MSINPLDTVKKAFVREPAPSPQIGTNGPIDAKRISDAEAKLKKYKDGKSALESRIVENEQWYKQRHWEYIRKTNTDTSSGANAGDPEPTSAWLFNSLANKHADAMDNYPEPAALPRERSDEQSADIISQVLPVILEQNDYEQVYSNKWWRKLKYGTAVTGVFMDPSKDNGLGDVDIRMVDLLNVFWEPGITDIQKSENFFHVDLVSDESLRRQYPDRNITSGRSISVKDYIYDDKVDRTGMSVVVDWYYKVKEQDGRTVLHYCKFVNGHVLYASENDESLVDRGFYDHGQYPFVFDVLFPVEGSPAGFGFVDICRSPQMFIDKLDQAILKNAAHGARRRYFVKGDGNVNEQEYADVSKDFVHFYGSGDPNESIKPIEVPTLPAIYENVRINKIEELKETSGNRDFSQGGTTSGVTAAAAIAALQEAGSKLSRDFIKGSYRAHVKECYLIIEVMRQFYDEVRMFRITNDQGKQEFVEFSGRMIAEQEIGDMVRKPVFDIKVKAQRSSPFSTVAQNERAKELYGLGLFLPSNADQSLAALDMMQFEGIEKVRDRISMNGTLFQKLQQITPILLMLAQEHDQINGTNETMRIAQMLGMEAPQAAAPTMSGVSEPEVNALGRAYTQGRNNTAEGARAQAARKSTPKTA